MKPVKRAGSRRVDRPVQIIGWREWLALPDLGIEAIKAKVDTGAQTSALHAIDVRRFRRGVRRMVRFDVIPYGMESHYVVTAEAELIDERTVRDSGGHAERRPVIRTTARMLDTVWPIELTLTDRAQMGFRMLLGRQGLKSRFLVDPGKSFRAGQPARRR